MTKTTTNPQQLFFGESTHHARSWQKLSTRQCCAWLPSPVQRHKRMWMSSRRLYNSSELPVKGKPTMMRLFPLSSVCQPVLHLLLLTCPYQLLQMCPYHFPSSSISKILREKSQLSPVNKNCYTSTTEVASMF